MAQDHDLPFKMSRPPDMDDDPEAGTRLIAGPANALLITACLALALNCLGGIAWNAVTKTTGEPPRPPGMNDEEYYNYKLGKGSGSFPAGRCHQHSNIIDLSTRNSWLTPNEATHGISARIDQFSFGDASIQRNVPCRITCWLLGNNGSAEAGGKKGV